MATVIDLAWGGSVPGNMSIRPIDPSLTDNFLTSGAEYYEPKRDFNAIGDGSTDDSVAVNLCIAAALAAGHRKMEIAEEYYVPTMSKEAADLIFVGDGSLVSSPVLKPIIPKDASPPRPPLTTFRASQHCPMGSIAAARGEVTIVLMGDSVSTPQVNGVSYIGNFHGKLREAFERDNPGVTINWYNRGIGGMNWDTLPDNHFGTVVQQWYDVNQPWLDYVEDLAPDVVIVSCARNGGVSFQMKHIRDALAIMQGWAKVPDIIMTNSIGETQTEATTSTVLTAAETRQRYMYAAEGIRSYALANGYGLIDTETQFSQLNLGFAQENLPLLRDGSIIGEANTGNYDVVMPWTASVPVYGWGGAFRVGLGDWTTMGNEFSFQIGGAKSDEAKGCRFWLKRDGGTFEISYRITVSRTAEGGSEDYTFVDWTATGVTCTESQFFSFTFHQQGSRVYLGYLTPGSSPATPVNIANNAYAMFHGYVPRCGGEYTPTITCTAGAASNVLTWTGATDEYASLTQMLHPRALNMPELTDREFASPDIVPLLPWGGGGPHQGTLAAELIIERAIQLNDFSFQWTAAAYIPTSSVVPTNGMYLPAANTLGWAINSAAEMQLTSTALSPAVSDGSALGTSSLMWGDLFLASGGVINFNASNVTITHSAAALGITGATVTVTRSSTDGSGITTGLSVLGAQSVAHTGTFYGASIAPSYSASSGNTLAALYGISSAPVNTGTGTITAFFGTRSQPINSNSGTVGIMRAVDGIPQNTSTGTVTDMYAGFFRCDNTNAGGTVTNAYGAYVAAPSNSGTMTNKWGVYQIDTASKNFFGGRTLIGTVTDDGSTAFQVNGNAKSAGYFLRSVGNALTATGTTRADALQLAKEVNRLTTVAASTGVILPVGVVGMRIRIFHAGASPVKVYASASETIDGVAGATGVTLTNALRCEYEFVAANTWISAQLGVVSA